MSITAEEKAKVISDFATKKGDTGSPEVQIAILTSRINTLTEHFKEHHKDCLLYTSPSPRDKRQSRMPSSA